MKFYLALLAICSVHGSDISQTQDKSLISGAYYVVKNTSVNLLEIIFNFLRRFIYILFRILRPFLENGFNPKYIRMQDQINKNSFYLRDRDANIFVLKPDSLQNEINMLPESAPQQPVQIQKQRTLKENDTKMVSSTPFERGFSEQSNMDVKRATDQQPNNPSMATGINVKSKDTEKNENRIGEKDEEVEDEDEDDDDDEENEDTDSVDEEGKETGKSNVPNKNLGPHAEEMARKKHEEMLKNYLAQMNDANNEPESSDEENAFSREHSDED